MNKLYLIRFNRTLTESDKLKFNLKTDIIYNIYKVGISCVGNFSRLDSYQNKLLLFLQYIDKKIDIYKIEKDIINEFKLKYILYDGNEYFLTSEKDDELINNISIILNNYNIKINNSNEDYNNPEIRKGCNKTAKNNKNIKITNNTIINKITINKTGKKQYICDFCNYDAKTNTNLHIHNRSQKHKTNVYNYENNELKLVKNELIEKNKIIVEFEKKLVLKDSEIKNLNQKNTELTNLNNNNKSILSRLRNEKIKLLENIANNLYNSNTANKENNHTK